MAEAPGHLLGQIIGNALEESLHPLLQSVADRHSLYLDKHGSRPARLGNKLTWTDDLGNSHDLDFVLERGGSPTQIGAPAAFIESAWRRYTKHSRAKAQEIQGALLPLLLKHSDVKPFAGAVVAGNWTRGALAQLHSSGFSVLHLDYSEIVGAFATAGIDVDTNEATPDAYLREQVDRFQELSESGRQEIAGYLCAESSGKYQSFRASLEDSLTRRVAKVFILALSGNRREYTTVASAIEDLLHLQADSTFDDHLQFVRFEAIIRYSNGDEVSASFARRNDLVAFMRTFTDT